MLEQQNVELRKKYWRSNGCLCLTKKRHVYQLFQDFRCLKEKFNQDGAFGRKKKKLLKIFQMSTFLNKKLKAVVMQHWWSFIANKILWKPLHLVYHVIFQKARKETQSLRFQLQNTGEKALTKLIEKLHPQVGFM